MNNETCIHGGISPVSLLKDLHHSQAGSGRHRCPTCAYEQGFILGSSKRWNSYFEYSNSIPDAEECQLGSIAPSLILKNLGDNQGGTGRHKCTNCAFKKGFEVGVLENKIDSIKLDLVPAPKNGLNTKDRSFKPFKNVDFIKNELENKRLGFLGELFVIKNEKDILNSYGRKDLADLVEHSSEIHGDGLGYDILSFDINGDKKYIEVKTTRSEINRPFYLTKNEIEFSKINKDNYYLYRLFDFDTNLNIGKFYKLKGDLYKELNLDAILYLAIPR
ncbi:hypothetical protein B0A58_09350 [Flavobacterium branchiophilum NBRC 15030 = ATCC 35035]|uniref:Uncharacterized protein DUF3883 n=1 Tax=Flavobacterium branchiophilum TaxID=55197 RepID=A0A543G0K0_9FLAO|nr:DUF3883 domain-containing protein [Flavobacterium branchiophilum]OXA75115.1 hypothetical protein B0A58_09350 [Flavobacterium branchiophilum NBRC 15030 = ATCC 35035]TQM39597.1 uncharacterized protein DUF3883 [Flavobacterium branchiophilum]GEM56491.1 hypothetical protein FB1_27120 [Flavobacterium branchiophilum NBRC 15030 = ATCC 35035]